MATISYGAQEPVPNQALPTLTRVEEIRSLTPQEAKRANPVKVTGVLTLAHPERGLFFLADGTGGIFVAPPSDPTSWKAGQKVEVTGSVAVGSHLPFITSSQFRDLGSGTFPPAKKVTLRQLATDENDCNWVEVQGVVRNAGFRGTYYTLELAAEGLRLNVICARDPDVFAAMGDLVDSVVRVQGVCGMMVRDPNSRTLLDIHMPYATNMAVVVPAPKSLDLIPKVTIGSLLARKEATNLVHRVLVRGELVVADNGNLRVRDPEGSVAIEAEKPYGAKSGQTVDVMGYPVGEPLVLQDARVRFYDSTFSTNQQKGSVAGQLPILTKAREVRSLSIEEARNEYPIKLLASVTFASRNQSVLFVKDDTAGIYVQVEAGPLEVVVGDVVEIDGYSDPGRLAPMVNKAHVRTVGKGPLPEAKQGSYQEMMGGWLDCERIFATGVIQSARLEGQQLHLGLGMTGVRLDVFLPDYNQAQIPNHLLDAGVRILGVCGAQFSQKLQFKGSCLWVNSLNDITVVRPAPSDPFVGETIPIVDLLRHVGTESIEHRLRIRGTVTYRDPSGVILYVQDEGDGIGIQTVTAPTVEEGDLVDVAGFITPRPFGPIMSEAVLRRVGKGTMPKPVRVSKEDMLAGIYDGQLVTVKARVVGHVRGESGQGLLVQLDEYVFAALLDRFKKERVFGMIQPGSLVNLTGICSVQETPMQNATMVRFLLRNPSDVVVLERPPRWTMRHVLQLLVVVVGVLAVVAGWVLMLRHRVREQTEIIRAKVAREAALEDRYRELFDHANDIVYAHDLDGHVTDLNRAGERIFGYNRSEISQLNIATLLGEEHARCVQELTQSTKSPHGRISFELETVARDGKKIHLENSSWLVEHDGRPVGVQGIARDITDRKHLEEQLRQLQKMEAVGQLAGGVAHDFNNILAAILMHMGLLQSDPRLDPGLKQSLKEVEAEANRAANLTRQLLLFSRRQLMQMRPLDLNEVLDNLLKMLRRLLGETIALEFQGKSNLPCIMADPGMVEQMVVNLSVNARDAMPKGGRLTIVTSLVDITPATMPDNPEARPGRFVCLAVSDTGTGIDQKILQHIFEPFFTTKDVGKGTGLGLATVHGIVKQHQGWIEVESRVEMGTTFRVFLPATRASVQVPASAPVETDLQSGHETILLVEDEPSVRRLVELCLCRQGYKVVHASKGTEALELWRQHKQEIDLLFTDMVMPEGITGLELAERMRRDKGSLKVVICSGYSMDVTTKGVSRGAGMAYLSKPFKEPVLIAKVRRCLDGLEDTDEDSTPHATA